MATPYYRVGDKYFDTTAKVLYRCTTAGDKTSSVWVSVSGSGGGGVASYTFKADGGDYIICDPGSGVATVTLSSGFTNGASVSSVTVSGTAGITAGQYFTGIGVPNGVKVISVNTGTNVVTVGTFTSTAASSGNYFFGYVYIAKPPKLRCSITSETYVDGSGLHTYTYAAVTVGGVIVAYNRTNTWTGGVAGSELEQITPAYLVGDTVYALAMPTINMPVAPGGGSYVAVSLIDIHEHDWAT